MLDFILALTILVALALCAGAVFLWRRGETRKAVLMGALAFVMLSNVAIWLVPMDDGQTPMESAQAVGREEAGQ